MSLLKNEFDFRPKTVAKDFLAGIIVFLVALPLCLGIAVASGATAMSGLIAGIVGGIVVGLISGSHTSVSGPAAGLTVIVAAQINSFGGLEYFEIFLLAVFLAGVIQVGFGLMKMGVLSAFFPSSVIKGLLAAIGLILILKQLAFLFGYGKTADMATEGGVDPDHVGAHKNNLLEFFDSMKEVVTGEFQWGATVIGIFSLLFLIGWDRVKVLKSSLVPAPLLVVMIAVAMNYLFSKFLDGTWILTPRQLVDVPVSKSVAEFVGFLRFPDFSQITNEAVYLAAFTIAIVASLETLLNLDAIDKIDRRQRVSPPNRELFAQGIGNMSAGLLGGIPVTSVVVRGSVNVLAGSETKLSAIFHGILLLGCVALLPQMLNMIPLSSLAAILLLTGWKLASPKLFKQMLKEGRYQFSPFILTLLAIVMTDLLIGILIGLALSVLFILHGNLKRPVRMIHEKHVDGDLLHIELPSQVSFLNRASLEQALRSAPRGSRIMLDGRRTNYIDPDILSLIRDFQNLTAPVYEIQLDLVGFEKKFLNEVEETVDFSKQESRENLTPSFILQVLNEGNLRYVEGHPLDRDLRKRLSSNDHAKQALAVIFTGIDSKTPVELIFDLGLGEAYVIRTPGNVVGDQAIGGMEYAVSVGGAKLIVVLGHADSQLIRLAIQNLISAEDHARLAGCDKLEEVLDHLALSIDSQQAKRFSQMGDLEQASFIEQVARKNLNMAIANVMSESAVLKKLTKSGKVGIIGALVDVETGLVEFLNESAIGLEIPDDSAD